MIAVLIFKTPVPMSHSFLWLNLPAHFIVSLSTSTYFCNRLVWFNLCLCIL